MWAARYASRCSLDCFNVAIKSLRIGLNRRTLNRNGLVPLLDRNGRCSVKALAAFGIIAGYWYILSVVRWCPSVDALKGCALGVALTCCVLVARCPSVDALKG